MNATGAINDPNTGWSFYGQLQEPGFGYVIDQLMHDNHPFANNIRVEAILIGSEFRKLPPGATGPVGFERHDNFNLGMKSFGTSSIIKRTHGPSLQSYTGKDPRGFYDPQLTTATAYEISNIFDEPDQQLGIGYGLMFTPYNKTTNHEPAGILKAARVYPVVNFLSPTPSKPLKDPKARITGVRVIYRIELSLSGVSSDQIDAFYKEKNPHLSEDERLTEVLKAFLFLKGKNMAGIWKDKDDPDDPLIAAAAMAKSGKWPGYPAFDAAEKPLAFEVAASGILEGAKRATAKGTLWDNIHQWWGGINSHQELVNAGKYPGGMVPTPGTPYAAHFHWRWGEIYYRGSSVFGFPSGTQKQFGGIGGAGGPMIDPKLPDQDLNFAITLENKYDVSKDITSGVYDQSTYSWKIQPLNINEPFDALLTRTSGLPRFTQWGDKLVLWVDVMARSNYATDIAKANANPFEGTFFVNGIFFAHESLTLPAQLKLIGAYKPQYYTNTPTKKWDRY